MELMNVVLEDLEALAIAQFDDILIFSKPKEEHLSHLQKVFDRIREHSLKLKLSKCSFAQQATDNLGFVISQE